MHNHRSDNKQITFFTKKDKKMKKIFFLSKNKLKIDKFVSFYNLFFLTLVSESVRQKDRRT